MKAILRARGRRALEWIAVALLLVPWGARPRERAGASSDLALRLAGPVASLAASVHWVRFDLEIAAGRSERAYALADRALALDPRSAEGWLTLGRHLLSVRGSLANEPDPARRRRWMRAGLDTLARGESVSSDPAALAFARGLYLHALIARIPDPELGWPGGARAALDEARDAYERARELGQPLPASALELLRGSRVVPRDD